jgi:hypothetical protein
MRKAILATALVFAACGAASAAQIRECNGEETAANIEEPWEKNAHAFDNGEVRVALIDTGGEPACCSYQLLLLTPDPQDKGGARACHLVTNTGGVGFGALYFDKLAAHYDPKTGLSITFRFATLGLDGKPNASGIAHVRVNTRNGKITAE